MTVIAVAEREPDVWASVGVHPHEADAHPDLGAAALVEASRASRAWSRSANAGSIIITTSPTAPRSASGSRRISTRRAQTGLPLVIHTRDAEDDTAEILTAAKWGRGASRASCTASPAAPNSPDTALDLGFYISISGIVTFKNARGPAGDRQDHSRSTGCWSKPTRRSSPRCRTAARPCEPAFVADTAAFLAELRGEPFDELASATTANFFRLFGKAAA